MITEIKIDRKKASLPLPKDIVLKREASEEPDLSTGVREALSSKLLFDTLRLGSKLTLLCGGNGSGKTTLIRSICGNRDCMDFSSNVLVYEYRNSENNYLNSTVQHELRSFDRTEIAKYADYRDKHDKMEGMSEGEASTCSSSDAVMLIEEVNEQNHKQGLVLLDELDSGLSIDKIRLLCIKLRCAMRRGCNAQVIMSFNSYEVYKCMSDFGKAEKHSEWLRIISMYDGSDVTFKSYDEYCDWIQANQNLYCKGRGKLKED